MARKKWKNKTKADKIKALDRQIGRHAANHPSGIRERLQRLREKVEKE